MKAVLQRVSQASVAIDGRVVGRIERGLVVLLGVEEGDDERHADALVDKMVHLRIFADEEGKMNRSVCDTSGKILLISQFTLLADCKKGRRPSFVRAGKPDVAKRLYEYVVDQSRARDVDVETGQFGANMQVSLINDGPVTIMLDSKDLL